MISLARGIPAPECLPTLELADCARAVLESDGATALNYGPGDPNLAHTREEHVDTAQITRCAEVLRRFLTSPD